MAFLNCLDEVLIDFGSLLKRTYLCIWVSCTDQLRLIQWEYWSLHLPEAFFNVRINETIIAYWETKIDETVYTRYLFIFNYEVMLICFAFAVKSDTGRFLRIELNFPSLGKLFTYFDQLQHISFMQCKQNDIITIGNNW